MTYQPKLGFILHATQSGTACQNPAGTPRLWRLPPLPRGWLPAPGSCFQPQAFELCHRYRWAQTGTWLIPTLICCTSFPGLTLELPHHSRLICSWTAPFFWSDCCRTMSLMVKALPLAGLQPPTAPRQYFPGETAHFYRGNPSVIYRMLKHTDQRILQLIKTGALRKIMLVTIPWGFFWFKYCH